MVDAGRHLTDDEMDRIAGNFTLHQKTPYIAFISVGACRLSGEANAVS